MNSNHKYLEPAFEAYKRAGYLTPEGKVRGEVWNGPWDEFEDEIKEEVKRVKALYEEMSYDLKKISGDEEETKSAYSLIDGMDQFSDYSFHDSIPIYFEHTKDRAVLRLNDYDFLAELIFKGVLEIEVNADPLTNCIKEFYCYKSLHNDKILIFDIESYRIVCKSIQIENITGRSLNQ